MLDSLPLRDRYLAFIDSIIDTILQGKISSGEQVYQMLLKGVTSGTGEIFELALSDRSSQIQEQVEQERDELRKAKATRRARAVKTIETQWQKWQEQHKATEIVAGVIREITTSVESEVVNVFLRVIDPNQQQPLNLSQLQQIAKALFTFSQSNSDLQQISLGIIQGISSWQELQENLLSWMYEHKNTLGFGGVPGDHGPWASWAKLVQSQLPQAFFRSMSLEQSIVKFALEHPGITLSSWIELVIVLQYLRINLVNWFDQQAYDIQAGPKLSISTYLTFAVIWSQLANGLHSQVPIYSDASRQILLQILRDFAQRPYFPLYGGIFASFSGSSLRDTLDYFDEPLKTVEGTQEKARILTLLGYSQRALGKYSQSIQFHQQALEIATKAGDHPCEIANFNHLSRTYVQEKNYVLAINYSQRALVWSRQVGDRIGEANALVNLGYSEVMQIQQLESIEKEAYEQAISYLAQGLKLAEKLNDVQSQALCFSSLGIAYLFSGSLASAIKYLEDGFKIAQVSGDLYLQGRNLAYLAEAYYQMEDREKAIYTGCLGMYLLEQISSREWRQPAGLLTVLQGQIGSDKFQVIFQQNRARIVSFIGVDGYEYIPKLWEKYQHDN